MGGTPIHQVILKQVRSRLWMVFLAVLGIGTVGTLWQLFRLSQQLYQGMALQGTSLQSLTLQTVRRIYSAEVVDALLKQKFHPSHQGSGDHEVLLPATLTMKIGEALAEQRPGAEVRLYSDYPFPWRRETGGARDTFECEALARLRENPVEPVYRFEDYKGRPSLRFATADRMQSDCVSCHNQHPSSPKRDWKVGDVRGVLEVVRPLDDVGAVAVARTRAQIKYAFVATVGIAALGLAGLVVMILNLRSNSGALAKSEARNRAVVEHAADAIITITPDGLIASANSVTEKTFGYRAEELLGANVNLLMPSPDRERHDEYIKAYLATGHKKVIGIPREVTGRRKDGTLFPMELLVSEIRVDHDIVFAGILRDISERKRVQEFLAERAKLAVLDRDVGIALSRGGEMRPMLQACTEALVLRIGAAFARIWTHNEAEQMLDLQASAGLYTHIDGGHARVPVGQFKIGLIAAERKAHLTNDVLTDPRLHDKEWARREGMVAFAGHPLVVADRLVGVMALFARQPLSDQVLDALASVADGVALGIQRCRMETDKAELNKQLVGASRQAGMAEVATGVLHNVGNVLNSVNVSATVLRDGIEHSQVASLRQAMALFQSHRADLAEYLTQDDKGKLLPGFLVQVADLIGQEQANAVTELSALSTNIEHIKTIIATQQSYARINGINELVCLSSVFDDAVRMSSSSFSRHEIELICDLKNLPRLTLDRQRLLQILVNCIRNAKHSIDERNGPKKQLIIRGYAEGGRLRLEISDTGVGIPPENLTRIFSHGFTTKKNGHGFGLHASALAAKEMGGHLTAASPGVGLGATFVLELPAPELEMSQ